MSVPLHAPTAARYKLIYLTYMNHIKIRKAELKFNLAKTINNLFVCV